MSATNADYTIHNLDGEALDLSLGFPPEIASAIKARMDRMREIVQSAPQTKAERDEYGLLASELLDTVTGYLLTKDPDQGREHLLNEGAQLRAELEELMAVSERLGDRPARRPNHEDAT